MEVTSEGGCLEETPFFVRPWGRCRFLGGYEHRDTRYDLWIQPGVSAVLAVYGDGVCDRELGVLWNAHLWEDGSALRVAYVRALQRGVAG